MHEVLKSLGVKIKTFPSLIYTLLMLSTCLGVVFSFEIELTSSEVVSTPLEVGGYPKVVLYSGIITNSISIQIHVIECL